MLLDSRNPRQHGGLSSSQAPHWTILCAQMATLKMASSKAAFLQVQRAALAMGTGIVVAASLPLFGRIRPADLVTLVFLAAVLWIGAIGGPRSGGVAAVTATAGYTLLALPDILSGSSSASIVVRALAFALVGVGSGFLISRLKDVFGRIENSGHHDAQSETFSAAYMHELIHLLSEEHRRYTSSFALIEVPAVLELEEVSPVGRALHRVARASDAVGRSEDGGFLVVLPNADRDDALALARRIKAECLLPGRPEIPVRTYSMPEDFDLLQGVGSAVTREASLDRD